MSFTTGGSFPASLVPSQARQTLSTNYLSFDSAAGGNFAQQYLPELYEAEVERYGNRTISGFLRMVGAEMPMTSDQVIWSEQNRLHVAYDKAQVSLTGAGANSDITVTVDLTDANSGTPYNGTSTCAIRVGQTILMADNATGLIVQKGLVQAVGASPFNVLTVKLYGTDANLLPTIAGGINLYVYGADFGKGSVGTAGS